MHFVKKPSFGHSCAKSNPLKDRGCSDLAHLDAPGFDAALQELCLRAEAAQQVPILIHSSHCVQVVMHQSAQGHLQGQGVRSDRAGQGQGRAR